LEVIPLGIRNRNVGNIRPSTQYRWKGEIGESGGFVVFDSFANGIRALCLNLLTYQDKYGIYAIRQAITRWAPPADHNDTEAYIVATATVLDCDDEDKFDFRNPDFLFWMVVAIGEQECGHNAFNQYVKDSDILAGVNAALA